MAAVVAAVVILLSVANFLPCVLTEQVTACIYNATNQKHRLGCLNLTQNGSTVTILGSLRKLPDGAHGFHIHEKGLMGNACADAGAHFNPTHQVHGGPGDLMRHVGDLGNIVSTNGEAIVNIADKQIALDGPNSIIGRAVVVHSDEDDLGKGGAATSNTTGNAGTRLACGIVTRGSAGSRSLSLIALVILPVIGFFF